ncbi:Wall-associated receptor kinase-like [Actinidia chinensis var. chinensis]|uniref:Wall-associated receptor kinase-like n=1 Tax=Actinidia chinensis var. chinensis TaxID=1590841 RepID=A0A2R6RN13_ACTCC|nr:Wall-associated receptor kinase-like [Actinidia chinensis var. chinensis]
MNTRTQTQKLLFFAICIVPSIFTHAQTKCKSTCGFGPLKRLKYPFGFSSGCPIQLNCSGNGTAMIDEFPVQSVSSDSILIKIPAKCDRPIKTLHRLFSRHYAPTSRNGILLHNCTSPIRTCTIPSTSVQTHLELGDCGPTGNISCYSEEKREREFIDYVNATSSGCKSLFSAISVEALGNGSSSVALDVQVVELGWWLEGGCLCSQNANCTEIVSPVEGRPGHRCRCLGGFVGDGYRAGFGCRKASSSCNAGKYMSGQCDGTTRVGVLVGGIVAGAVLMVGVALTCCFIRRRSKLKHWRRTTRLLSKAAGISIPIYPYKEIEKATNFFSDKQCLGTGAYGTVYAGKLNKEEWVAIKRIKHRDTDSIEQVMNEIKLLSSVSHPNLVRLLGCSIEKGEQILLYEFMPNGTLSQHLHRERSDGLTWPVRLKIATETAQAIAYLHSAMNPPIYHRDIKSSNILLDFNLRSKVADFGLSRLGLTETSHISTAPQGTPGYLDPQYHQHFHLSDKSDVYSLGVVLVEIITAQKVVDFCRPQNEVNLASLAMDRIVKGRLEEIIDPLFELQTDDGWTLSSIHKVAELAFRCLAYDQDMRPSMIEVAIMLEQIRLSRWANSKENITPLSETSSCSLSSS